MNYNTLTNINKCVGKHRNKKWYRDFCAVYDNNGCRAAQSLLAAKGNLADGLKNLFKVDKLDMNVLYALRSGECSMVCPLCNNVKGIMQTACSKKCAAKLCVPKREATSMERYGVSNPSSAKEVQEKRAATTIERHGAPNAFQSKKLMKKARATLLANYGVTNPSHSPELLAKKIPTMIAHFGETHWTKAAHMKHKMHPFTKEMLAKASATCLKRYGVSNPFYSEEFLQKARDTCMERHGYENPFYSAEVQERIKDTILENYGVDNVFKHPEVQAKIRKTCLEKYGVEYPALMIASARTKVKDRFGKVHYVQGYEPLAINQLSKVQGVQRIVSGSDKVPSLRYKWPDGSTHRYYPDLQVFTRENMHIIEVKSTYTLGYRGGLEINIAKFKRATEYCQKRGATFWLFLYVKGMKLVKVKNPTSINDLREAGILV